WRQGQHPSAEQVEAAAMARTLDGLAVQLPVAKHAAVMGADVVDGAPLVVLGMADADRAAANLHHAHRARLDVRGSQPSYEAGAGGGHAASSPLSEPMRPASAPSTAERMVCDGICATTCSKKPRTIMRSASPAGSPRDWA